MPAVHKGRGNKEATVVRLPPVSGGGAGRRDERHQQTRCLLCLHLDALFPLQPVRLVEGGNV